MWEGVGPILLTATSMLAVATFLFGDEAHGKQTAEFRADLVQKISLESGICEIQTASARLSMFDNRAGVNNEQAIVIHQAKNPHRAKNPQREREAGQACCGRFLALGLRCNGYYQCASCEQFEKQVNLKCELPSELQRCVYFVNSFIGSP